MNEENLQKIGDVADLLGITQRTLRYYEEEELIKPLRTEKGTRLYSDEDISRVRVILLLVDADVPIQSIKELSKARSKSKSGDKASHLVSQQLNKLREEALEKKNKYALLEKKLGITDALVQQCFGCSHKPTKDTCFSCTVVPEFRNDFVVNLIAG